MTDIRTEQTADRERIFLGGDLTVQHIGEIAKALRDAIGRAAAVQVVFEKIGAVDMTLLQLFCSAHRTAEEAGKAFSVASQERDAFNSALRQAGFIRHVGCRSKSKEPCLWVCGGNR